jgi:copper oxidase (laccase) domain-containing protein
LLLRFFLPPLNLELDVVGEDVVSWKTAEIRTKINSSDGCTYSGYKLLWSHRRLNHREIKQRQQTSRLFVMGLSSAEGQKLECFK